MRRRLLYSFSLSIKLETFFRCLILQYLLIPRYHVPRSWLNDSDNLLVIFEETGGNPLDISIKLRATGFICAQVSESHYPPIHKWSSTRGSFDGRLSVNDLTPEMHLYCQDGYMISSIEFASYGTPMGGCQEFSIGKCHATNSSTVVSEVRNS